MRMTFTHKVIICLIAGFAAASLIEFYKVFVDGADDAINGGYRNRTQIEATK